MLDKSKLTSVKSNEQKDASSENTSNKASDGNYSPEEIAKFDKLAESWWDPNGSYKTAIEFNRARVEYFIAQICTFYNLDVNQDKPLSGLRILDVGCGGGLVCEPLAQAGASVTGIDVSEMSIEVAKRHASQSDLDIEYRHEHAEHTVRHNETPFDVVINAEVIEHVPNQKELVKQCSSLCKVGGCVIMATLNRTIKSFVIGIIGAEYIMRYLPRGTHSWYLFVTPFELNSMASIARMKLVTEIGMAFNVFNKKWRTTKSVSINYIQIYERLGKIR
ncbi:bifunctional 2-polyprenyl-6-hydroxyphenol methylase/3-demethylubiquinol 3-O-methyltransferase UbiG [Glaciecola petra]|uniref:Ubiquinone biosynthesis O-methyltransferase n=1 Tax=Glaciecola petra TaxID=3075602 RepID=A0ABU2ZU85_9ALTE|nr:bifunctional 2-polyprenyl-6-hydroxyphenol methylase/3-demethylubiquinol 3-O-methyltransferase UbiG [Aestuariibacter sp. P117]MDT0596204.1 bifunctional 2-polyprenyl-6-hydroxyphenol methylase/3-demethylubiquinol 3-O-methyltransferase UbiG [Aestuariibacter sp. P117]